VADERLSCDEPHAANQCANRESRETNALRSAEATAGTSAEAETRGFGRLSLNITLRGRCGSHAALVMLLKDCEIGDQARADNEDLAAATPASWACLPGPGSRGLRP
jgi:hypothetical protein